MCPSLGPGGARVSEPGTSRSVDTGTGQLLLRIEDRVAVLTLNRPEARNALGQALADVVAPRMEPVDEFLARE